MKTSLSSAFFALSAALLLADDHIESGYGESASPGETAAGDQSAKERCVNYTPYVEPEKKCKKSSSPSADTSEQNNAVATPEASVHAGSGNAQRIITDLELAGSPGTQPLEFSRFSATRLSNRSLGGGAFGREGSWSHNYE